MSWRFSLILVVALLAALGTVVHEATLDRAEFSGTVLNAYTLTPVSNASIVAGERSAMTGDDGRFKIPGSVSGITATKAGFERLELTVTPSSRSISVMLRPNVVAGRVVSAANQQPIAGATVKLTSSSGTIATTSTDATGSYTLNDVPLDATIEVSAGDFATVSRPLDHQTTMDVQLRPDVLVGKVSDEKGAPIANALVAAGDKLTRTSADGSYRLEGIGDSGTVVFKAPGFSATSLPVDPTLRLDAKLTPIKVKAIYATANTASDAQSLDQLIKIAETTEVNALVVDLKDSTGHVFYDSKVPLARDIGAVSPELDPAALVDKLHQHHIYAIARIVVFEDPILAEARPDWAIHDSSTGTLWRTFNGLAWVNAHRHEVWDYDVSIAKEAASFGFDEIQLDYIRFPTDGPLQNAEYGVAHDDQTRPAAIGDFLTEMYAAIAPTHAYLGVDIFGLTLWETGDGNIGQNLETVAKHVDYLCPMVYPSHFYAGSMGFDIPNDHPYEVVLWSLQNGYKRIPQDKAKLRPWLQDFSLGEGIAYGPTEVKRQIDASNDFGALGWMLWNAGNEYHADALAPDTSS